MGDDGKSVILYVESYGLHLFVYLDFGKTKITIEILVQDFHELKATKHNILKEIYLILTLIWYFSLQHFFPNHR